MHIIILQIILHAHIGHTLARSFTERCGLPVNSCFEFEGPGFKSWPRRPTIVIGVFNGIPQYPQANAGTVP
jgi:hypothetical protein